MECRNGANEIDPLCYSLCIRSSSHGLLHLFKIIADCRIFLNSDRLHDAVILFRLLLPFAFHGLPFDHIAFVP